MEYIRLADHPVERVEIPYQGRTLARYFHLPTGYSGRRLPCLVMAKTLVLYSGELHGLGDTRSSQLGPFNLVLLADWLHDRADGKPLDSEYIVVDSQGQLHSQPWGENRVYEYGAPMDFRHLFGDTPSLPDTIPQKAHRLLSYDEYTYNIFH